jgi:hypothetical protein
MFDRMQFGSAKIGEMEEAVQIPPKHLIRLFRTFVVRQLTACCPCSVFITGVLQRLKTKCPFFIFASNSNHTGAEGKRKKTCFETRKIICLSVRTIVLRDTSDQALSISAFD